MKRLLLVLPLASAAFANPLFDGADPHAMTIGRECWIFPTEAHSNRKILAAYHSADLKNWKREGPLLDLDEIPWVKEDNFANHAAWAPAMAEKRGHFFFYFAVGPQGPGHPSRIGVATGDSPAAKFRDSGRPLLTGGDGFEAIDPMVFVDSFSRKSYLYAGGSAGAKLKIFELSDDMLHLGREIECPTPPHFTEGPFLHFRGGIYYLSYSSGSWNSPSYSVHYCTSSSPIGPWTYRGKILESDDNHQGPGHHSFIKNPGNDDWQIVYHRWETTSKQGPFRGNRKIAIDRITYDKNGLILPIVMTDGEPAPPFTNGN